VGATPQQAGGSRADTKITKTMRRYIARHTMQKPCRVSPGSLTYALGITPIPPTMPLSIVLLTPQQQPDPGLQQTLLALGARVLLDAAAAPQAGASQPDPAPWQVVLSGADPTWCLAQLAAWAALAPLERPCITWLGPALGDSALDRALAAGLSGWWPRSIVAQPAELSAALALDLARWQRGQSVAAELARAQAQLQERKWVDRAKGVLMSARGIGEDEAFRLIRGAAMHANLRLGEVSRSVIDAAAWAEALNRAGQLRMLSQRLVKLAAQRQAGVEVRRAKTLQDSSAQRVQDNLDHLARLPQAVEGEADLGGVLARATQAWEALQAALAQRPSPATLRQADHEAEGLLGAAEALSEALQTRAQRRALHIINLCGRQRMRVQRLAKQALLASLLDEPQQGGDSALVVDEVETALLELERAPLSSPEIRAAQAAARDEWLRLLRGLRSAHSAEGRAVLARSSEALLEVFDQLTAHYERSLQVIMS
jgi:hypothetical protein